MPANAVNIDIAARLAVESVHGTAGQWTANSREGLAGQLLTGSELHLSAWTAPRTEVVTQVSTWCTVTSATITKQQLGVYSVDPDSGDITLVGSTPHDAAIWQGALIYTKAFSLPITLQAGTRYALGALFVGTTAPTLVAKGASVNVFTTGVFTAASSGATLTDATLVQTGIITAGVLQSIQFSSPWQVARVASQTALPATVVSASVVVSTNLTGKVLARLS